MTDTPTKINDTSVNRIYSASELQDALNSPLFAFSDDLFANIECSHNTSAGCFQPQVMTSVGNLAITDDYDARWGQFVSVPADMNSAGTFKIPPLPSNNNFTGQKYSFNNSSSRTSKICRLNSYSCIDYKDHETEIEESIPFGSHQHGTHQPIFHRRTSSDTNLVKVPTDNQMVFGPTNLQLSNENFSISPFAEKTQHLQQSPRTTSGHPRIKRSKSLPKRKPRGTRPYPNFFHDYPVSKYTTVH